MLWRSQVRVQTWIQSIICGRIWKLLFSHSPHTTSQSWHSSFAVSRCAKYRLIQRLDTDMKKVNTIILQTNLLIAQITNLVSWLHFRSFCIKFVVTLTDCVRVKNNKSVIQQRFSQQTFWLTWSSQVTKSIDNGSVVFEWANMNNNRNLRLKQMNIISIQNILCRSKLVQSICHPNCHIWGMAAYLTFKTTN